MANKAVNTDEIKSQAVAIRTSAGTINAECTGLSGQIELISSVIKAAGDSSSEALGKAWLDLSERVTTIGTKFKSNGEKLADALDKYATESANNEEAASSSVDAVSSNVTGIDNLLKD